METARNLVTTGYSGRLVLLTKPPLWRQQETYNSIYTSTHTSTHTEHLVHLFAVSHTSTHTSTHTEQLLHLLAVSIKEV